MSAELIKFAFVAGEVSPTYIGRSDLEQYDFGMALAKNWFVDYRGGLSTRPGQEFTDYMKYPLEDSKFFSFQFSPDTSNTYIIVFDKDEIRFVQDGAYVVEPIKTITAITPGAEIIFTSAGHGYAVGNLVRMSGFTDPLYAHLNNRTFIVTQATAPGFVVRTVPGDLIGGATALVGVAGVARIYTIASPYAVAALADLRADQIRDNMRFTHNAYPIYNLKRIAHDNWTITPEALGNTHTRPQISGIAFSSAGTAGVAFAVTAVFDDGSESLASNVETQVAGVNYTTTAGSCRVTWTVVPGAVKYRVYRSAVLDQASINRGMQLGYIGATQAVEFTDNNIVPDYTKAPPEFYNPFATGAIRGITVTAAGIGYTLASVLSVTGGTGFIGNLVVSPTTTTVNNVGIVNGGEGYTAPGYSITVGAGATLSFELSPLTGTYPALSTTFQQRQIYASSANDPLTVWGSRPGQFSNFDVSSIVVDSDSYEFDLDSAQVTPIRHMFVVRGGLMLMTQTGIFLLSGGGTESIVTPTNALAQPQAYTGVSKVPPLKINTDLLYIEGKGTTVRLLSYNEYSRVYSGDDVSILSNHLMTLDNSITKWTYAENPYKVVWAVRFDGAMLGFTIVKEQKVFAWTQHSTRGFYKDIITVQEDQIDRTYMAVVRIINGHTVKMIERQNTRIFSSVEDAVCSDAALILGANFPGVSLFMTKPENNEITLTTDANYWTVGMVGNIVRGGGGKFKIKTYVSPTEVLASVKKAPTVFLPEDDSGIPFGRAPGLWTNDVPVTTLGGLHHLEGETVSILADGNVFPPQEVVNGTVTLNSGVTRAVIGLGYTCLGKTLPPTTTSAVIESRRKRVVGLGTRVNDTRGLKFGPSLDRLTEMRDRTNELWGEPIALRNDMSYNLLYTNWDEEGQTYLVQDNPLPATVLSLVYDMEIGDDSD